MFNSSKHLFFVFLFRSGVFFIASSNSSGVTRLDFNIPINVEASCWNPLLVNTFPYSGKAVGSSLLQIKLISKDSLKALRSLKSGATPTS